MLMAKNPKHKNRSINSGFSFSICLLESQFLSVLYLDNGIMLLPQIIFTRFS